MQVAGIICEYNPFHRGHAEQIAAVRQLLGRDTAVLCVMSGNFVQRGDFAVFGKHARAKAAVLCGADLVVELPVPWAVSSAERFAFGGVSLLHAAGLCTHLCFGSETGRTEPIVQMADYLLSEGAAEALRQELKSGVSFAAARQRAAEAQDPETASVLTRPNDLLGVEYIKALRRLGSEIIPVALPRRGAAHDAESGAEGIASATAIRRRLLAGEEALHLLPEDAAAAFREEMAAGRGPVSGEACGGAILARLRTMTKVEYEALPDGSEGLSLRLMRCARREPTAVRVAEAAKTKRYALSRIRRMILCAYLGIRQEDQEGVPCYIRPLAFNERGRQLLRTMGETAALPVVTKPAAVRGGVEAAQRLFELEARTTDLYALAYPEPLQRYGGREWETSPAYVPGGASPV